MSYKPIPTANLSFAIGSHLKVQDHGVEYHCIKLDVVLALAEQAERANALSAAVEKMLAEVGDIELEKAQAAYRGEA